MSGIVLELAGLPGSGKSTLAGALVRRLRADGVPVVIADHDVSAAVRKDVRTARRLGHALREATVRPAAATRVTSVIVRSRQDAPRDVPAVLAQWLATAGLVAGSRPVPGVRLLEEGFAQTVWTAALRARRLPPEDLWACLPAGARTDLVLFLDVPPELAAHRLAARESQHSRLQRFPASTWVSQLRRGQEAFDSVLSTCPLTVTRVRAGEVAPDVLAGRVAAAVRTLAPGLPIRPSHS
jgi:thymidylate kinase